MAPQTMMLQLLTGTLLLLLPWFNGPTLGEISNDFSKCLQFFYNKTPPMGVIGSEYQPICQRYRNHYRFATLYNRKHRAPLYSAYILKTLKGSYPRPNWMYEPQLADPNASPEMQTCKVNERVRESQAVNKDYTGSHYTRGHLAPRMHQETQEECNATFTLTNIVPQKNTSNHKYWNQLEHNLVHKIKPSCNGPVYVITGTIPYRPQDRKLINNRVYVPEYLWSAYCCPSYSPNISSSSGIHFPTYAAVGRNDPDSGPEFVEKRNESESYGVQKMPLATLEGILRQRLNMNIMLFQGQCRVMV